MFIYFRVGDVVGAEDALSGSWVVLADLRLLDTALTQVEGTAHVEVDWVTGQIDQLVASWTLLGLGLCVRMFHLYR
jgi:hypothetical protein